ncbi:M1 family metallopeptidase [Sphingomonas sp. CJ20]
MRLPVLALCALVIPATAYAQVDPQPTGKLPDTVTPIAYRLNLTILPDQPRFSGHTEIEVELKKPASAVYMHGRDLHVTKAVAIIAGKEKPVTFTQKTPLGLALLDFGKTVAPGKMTLRFDYDAAFTDSPAGMYHLNIDKQWYSWTQFESIDARAAFPSFDEPGYKTPFTVSLTTRKGLVAISNAPETGTAPAGEMVTHSFAPTKPLPTYLMAFVVGPYAVAETVVPPTPQRKDPLPLRIVGTQPNKDKLQFALEQSGPIVALLERYFDQPFPYPKLDQIGSPVMPGAMENAGADIYGDGILFLDADSSKADKQTFGMVVAHELSHQWFGDLVTPAWWDDIWLNESFANWMGYRIGNEWRPDLNIGIDGLAEGFDAMDLDALSAGRPIHERIANDADINAAFDQITYGKGGQVVAMIADYLGDTKFRDGVRLHMQRHMYANASTDEFFTSLADSAKDPRVLASLRSFVDQQGVPVIALHRQGNALTATQSRYAYFGSNAPAEKWIIPLCIRRGADKSCTLLDQTTQPVEAKGTGPIVPNAGGWGYYRFDLDPADWDALIAAGPTLPEGEALALNDSLWASFYAGKNGVARPIALARAMTAHPSTKIMFENADEVRALDAHGLITPDAAPAYRALIGALYAPALAKLGFDPAASVYAKEDRETRKLRADLVQILADTGHDAALRTKLATALDAYIAGDAKALDPRFATLAVSTTVGDRGVPFAKAIAEKALAGPPALRQSAFMGIAGSGNPDVARWFLNEFKDERLSATQRLFTTATLMKSPATRDLASDYMLTNYDAFVKAGGGGGIFSGKAAQMFGILCSLPQADAVDAKLRPQLGNESTLNLDRSLDAIRNCARFRDAKAGEVSAAIVAGK